MRACVRERERCVCVRGRERERERFACVRACVREREICVCACVRERGTDRYIHEGAKGSVCVEKDKDGDRHTDRILTVEIVRGEKWRASGKREGGGGRVGGEGQRDILRNRQLFKQP